MTIGAALLCVASGCAGSSGWSVTDAQVCAPKSAPRVCVDGEPDYGHVLELADVELLPGECAVASDEARGGLVRVETRDPRGARRSRWLGARKGKITTVKVREDGEPVRSGREPCDRTPP
ncbi:hypothetical protein ENSA5_50990 [Enhygromyxa salina]|uniref:Lipoprotein n=1 Tax=Enhygromyxa salina TaxID=215803 RepID=A0A2S9XH21_9BACT|nr:hypothetical protein ENSA5_50990 [Enhygromyxa salina]